MCSDETCPVCGLRRNLKEFARVGTPLDEVMDIIAFALEENFEVESAHISHGSLSSIIVGIHGQRHLQN